MKKVIIILVSILLITPLFINFGEANHNIYIGPGDGKDGEITSISELRRILKFVTNQTAISADQARSKTSPDDVIMLGISLDASGTPKGNVINHTSVTAQNLTTINLKIEENFSTVTSFYLDRDLMLYIDKDATFYHSVGEMLQYVKDQTSLQYSWDMECFSDSGMQFIKINSWTINGISVREQALKTWIVLPPAEAKEIAEIDAEWRVLFEQLYKFISDEAITFENNNGIYKSEQGDEDSSFYTIIDIRDKRNPYIERRNYERYSVANNQLTNQLNDTIVFSNIDNTSIAFDTDSVNATIFNSQEEFYDFICTEDLKELMEIEWVY